MIENIINISVVLIEILFLIFACIIEKRCINKYIKEEEEKVKKNQKVIKTTYAWIDITIVLSIIMMIFNVSLIWFLGICVIYVIYQLIELIRLMLNLNMENRISKIIQNKFVIFVLAVLITIVEGYVISILYVVSDIAAKPVIYIYPETETTVQVSVGYPEKLSCVYPEYSEGGWEVIAKPNGDLVDTKTGRNLYCLYWEGDSKLEYKFKDGFVVAGEDSAKFLEEKLAILGLNEREANEFIIYWLPKLEANKYNLIRFETAEEIESYMPLNIEPKPDTVIRVMMDFRVLNRPIEIEEQKLETPVREGYAVVEWGGSEF